VQGRTEVTKKIQKRELIPPWNMPSDPVKAVAWFLHWSLKVLVRFFWIPIIVMALFELYLNWIAGGAFNGLVGGIVTLFVGTLVWGALYGVSFLLNINTRIAHMFSEVGRMQQGFSYRSSSNPFSEPDNDESKIVEGTITDLDEERKKRRRE